MKADRRIPVGRHAGKLPEELTLGQLVQLVNGNTLRYWRDERRACAEQLLKLGWPESKIQEADRIWSPKPPPHVPYVPQDTKAYA